MTEYGFQKLFGDSVGGSPQQFLVTIMAMDETGHIPIWKVRRSRCTGLESNAKTGIVSGVEQRGHRNANDFFNFPIWKKPLLAVHPPHHGVDGPLEHDQLLDGQWA